MKQYGGGSMAGKGASWTPFRRISSASRAADAALPLLDSLAETVPAIIPLLGDVQAMAVALLRHRLASGSEDAAQLAHWQRDLASLERLQSYRTVLEKRFANGVTAASATALADGDAPAVDKRHDAAIDLLTHRLQPHLKTLQPVLQSLQQGLSAEGRVASLAPLHPRIWIHALLDTFPASECDEDVRALLVQLFAAVSGETLGQAYAAIHKTLATQAGLSSGGSRAGGKSADGTQQPALPPRSSLRSEAILQHLRALRERGEPPLDAHRTRLRELTTEEFQAILYLLQNSPRSLTAGPDPSAGFPARLREAVWYTASRIGIDAGQTCFAPGQADAIDITCRVFERLLQGHALAPAARNRLEQMALPYLRLVQAEPTLFDPPEHAMHRLLSLLAAVWDANAESTDADRRLCALADAAARSVIDNQNGDTASIEATLATLENGLEPYCEHARDAENGARMAAQTRERMQQSRRRADRALAGLLGKRRVLPSVAAFLSDQWRQMLIRTQLGGGSDAAVDRLLALGQELVAIDEASANGQGRSVAAQLLKIEPALRECCLAGGTPVQDSDRILSAMVAELATPDTQRERQRFEASSGLLEPGEPILPMGTVFVLQEADGAMGRRLKVAWHDADTGMHLLVDRHGQRDSQLPASEMARLYAEGQLQPRPAQGVLESLLAELADAARSDAGRHDPLGSLHPHED